MAELTGWFGNSINAWHDELARRAYRLNRQILSAQKAGRPAYELQVLATVNAALMKSLHRQYRKALAASARAIEAEPPGEGGGR